MVDISKARSSEEQFALLEKSEKVQSFLLLPHMRALYEGLQRQEHRRLFLLLLYFEAGALFFDPAKKTKGVEALLEQMEEVDCFYKEIGGLYGYVQKVRELLKEPKSASTGRLPHAESIVGGGIFAKHATTFGLAHLDRVAFLVPAGGLGARLSLVDGQQKPLPVAYLPFMGRSLLEGIIRDIEGLEALYYATYGRRITVPLALMTSHEQNNDANMRALFSENNNFGRSDSSLRLFPQISVPALSIEGNFLAKAPCEFIFQPSGHGAIWKTAEDAGIFRWLEEQRIEHLLLRQINNPLAALDSNLLALVGLAIRQEKHFGFLACERERGAAEGMLIDREHAGRHFITNIEYNQLPKGEHHEGLANTNILYAQLAAVRKKAQEKALFGPIVNMKSELPSYQPTGKVEKIRGGRLESMMQSISDSFSAKKGHPLPTLVVKNRRSKTIAAIKRVYDPEGGGALETAEAAYYTLLQNHHELLSRCTSEPLPLFSSFEEYLAHGPSLLFTYHPALGPLYEVIEKKLHFTAIARGAELMIEARECKLEEVELRGSLCIDAMGGRLSMRNVKVANLGIDRRQAKAYWKGEIMRLERAHLYVEEGGELVIEDMELTGNETIRVKAGERVIMRRGKSTTEALFSKVESP